MITAIYVKDKAKLTIVTQEDTFLEEKDHPERRKLLSADVDNIVDVGRGLFKMHSKKAVAVNGGGAMIHILASPNDKDGGPIDPPKVLMPPGGWMSEAEVAGIKPFLFSAALGESPPT